MALDHSNSKIDTLPLIDPRYCPYVDWHGIARIDSREMETNASDGRDDVSEPSPR